jgi:hypothetical protein
MIDQEITFGAAMGYSSGKNSSSLKTPPVQQIKRSYIRRNIIRFHKINIKLLAIASLSTYNISVLFTWHTRNGR